VYELVELYTFIYTDTNEATALVRDCRQGSYCWLEVSVHLEGLATGQLVFPVVFLVPRANAELVYKIGATLNAFHAVVPNIKLKI
jgi:hypothetical protein